MEAKKSTPRCTENIVRDLSLLLGSLQHTAAGKGSLWALGKSCFLCHLRHLSDKGFSEDASSAVLSEAAGLQNS